MEVGGQLRAPATLPPGKESRHTMDRRLGGHHSRSGRGGKEKQHSRESNSDRPARSLVTVLAELSRLLMQL
jgi:hypothetical protein